MNRFLKILKIIIINKRKERKTWGGKSGFLILQRIKLNRKSCQQSPLSLFTRVLDVSVLITRAHVILIWFYIRVEIWQPVAKRERASHQLCLFSSRALWTWETVVTDRYFYRTHGHTLRCVCVFFFLNYDSFWTFLWLLIQGDRDFIHSTADDRA